MTEWRGIKVGGLYKMTYKENPVTGALSRSEAMAMVVRIEPAVFFATPAPETRIEKEVVRVDVTLLQEGKALLTRSAGHIYDWDIDECKFDSGRYKVVA